MPKSNKDPDATAIDRRSPTMNLAERYLDALTNEAWGYQKTGFEPTIINADQIGQGGGPTDGTTADPIGHFEVARRKNPVIAALTSLLFPGGGFFYTGSYVAGLCFLFGIGASALIFASYSGLVPSIRDTFRYFSSTFPSDYVLLASGLAASVLAALSVMLPVLKARRTQVTHVEPHPLFAAFMAPVPVLGLYVQRKFFWGHVGVMSLFGFLASSVCTLSLWKEGGAVEPSWGLAAFAAGSALFLFLTSWLSGMVGALRICGIVSEPMGEPTEWKFVGLGVALLFCLSGYAVFYAPGQWLRDQGNEFSRAMAGRGFTSSSSLLKKGMASWQRRSEDAKDLLDLLM